MIKLAEDTIDSEDLKALSSWLLTEPRLTKGELCDEFERKFATWQGTKHAILVNSGSSAILLTLWGLICSGKIKKGDKVIVPAISWATDYASVVQCGLEPVFCDCNMFNVGVSLIHLEEILQKKKPAVLLLVSVLGMPPDMEEIKYMCENHNCILIEDNCESLGSEVDGQKLGVFGFASLTSFYFGHMLSTIEGGMIFTNDNAFADTLKMIRAHGWDRDLSEESKASLKQIHGISDFQSKYTFYYPGFNFRSTEINAFLGLRQLQKLDGFISRRKQNFEFLSYYIKNDYWKPVIPKENLVSNLGYPIIHPKRDRIVKALEEAGVECRPFISGNMARQPMAATSEKLTVNNEQLRNADIVHNYGLYVPNHPSLKEEDLYTIYTTINKVIN